MYGPAMPLVRNLRPGYTVTYPNRGKAASRATKLLVVLVMLASVVLMLALTIGGWSELQGLVPVNFACCMAYLVMAFWIGGGPEAYCPSLQDSQSCC